MTAQPAPQTVPASPVATPAPEQFSAEQWRECARAFLQLALELSLELRNVCDDPLHTLQIVKLKQMAANMDSGKIP